MAATYIEDRLENFRAHGFPIDRVISTGYDADNIYNNPKKKTIEDLDPVVFADDFRRNFIDIQGVDTKLIFIDNEYHDDPLKDHDVYYDAKYPSLLDFVKDFLKTEQHGEDIQWAERPEHRLCSV